MTTWPLLLRRLLIGVMLVSSATSLRADLLICVGAHGHARLETLVGEHWTVHNSEDPQELGVCRAGFKGSCGACVDLSAAPRSEQPQRRRTIDVSVSCCSFGDAVEGAAQRWSVLPEPQDERRAPALQHLRAVVLLL